MELKALALAVLAYSGFLLFSNCLNPFFRPVDYSRRRRWRLGRRMAIGIFLIGALVLFVRSVASVDLVSSAIMFAVLLGCYWALFSRRSIQP